MAEVVEHGIIITFDEIRILLYVMGTDSVKGVYMPEKEYTEREIIGALHHMVNAGYISVEKDRFVIDTEIKEFLEIMARPENTFIQPVSDGREVFCYISQGKVVVSEHFRKKKDTLKLLIFTADEFMIWREGIENDHSRSQSTYDEQII